MLTLLLGFSLNHLQGQILCLDISDTTPTTIEGSEATVIDNTPGTGDNDIIIETNTAQNIGFIGAGDKAEFTVCVAVSGCYELSAQIAAPNSSVGAVITFKLGNTTVGELVLDPATTNDFPTGGWQSYKPFTTNVNLTQGDDQTLTLEFAYLSGVNSGNMLNFDNFTLSKVANTAPSLSITPPVNSNITEGDQVSLSASASDTEDGNLSGDIIWTDQNDNVLGSGSNLDLSTLTFGSYTISATVLDACFFSASDNVSITVEKPCLEISNSTPTTIEGSEATLTEANPDAANPIVIENNAAQNIGFITGGDKAEFLVCVAADGCYELNAQIAGQNTAKGGTITFKLGETEVGTLTLDPDANDGDGFPTGGWQTYQTFTTNLNLTQGDDQTLTLEFSNLPNSTGNMFNLDKFILSQVNNTAPTVAITPPANTTITAGDQISLTATANDTEDGDVSGDIVWTDQNDNQLGIGANLDLSTLTEGVYTITASVIDGCKVSSSDQITITVEAPAIPCLEISDSTPTTIEGSEATLTESDPDADNPIVIEGNDVQNIGFITGGDKAEFKVCVPTTGCYVLSAQIAGANSAKGGIITFKLGETVVGTLALDPNPEDGDGFPTGNWQGYSEFASALNLTQGLDQTLSLEFTYLDGVTTGGMLNFDKFTLTYVDNTAPVLSIAPPQSNTIQKGNQVTLAADASDTEDGDISGDIVWTDQNDNVLGMGAGLDLSTLDVGEYTITATVSDACLVSATDNVSITVENAVCDNNTDPTVSITAPADNFDGKFGTNINFTATSGDAEDEVAPEISWTSDLDGDLGTGTNIDVILSKGTHVITASVTDLCEVTITTQITVVVGNGDPVTLPFCINAGGQNKTVNGQLFSKDTKNDPIIWKTPFNANPNNTFNTAQPITGAIDANEQDVLDTERFGVNFGYSIPVAEDAVDVSIYLAELFIGIEGGNGAELGVGDRVFDIIIEGVTVEDDLDIFATYGNLTKVVLTYSNIAVSDGTLDIQFSASSDNAKVNGICVSPATQNTPPTVSITSPQILDLENNKAYVRDCEGDDETVTITAVATDEEDGTISSNITWTVDDELFETIGASITPSLSIGTHTIVAKIADSNNETDEKTIVVEVLAAPSLAINSPTTNQNIVGTSVSAEITVSGILSNLNEHVHLMIDQVPHTSLYDDEDGTADGSFTKTFVFDNVAAGEHTIMLQAAQEDHTLYCSPVTVSFTTELPLVNQAPVADAGQNDQITLPTDSYQLNGDATDDGLPNGTLTYKWTAIGENSGNVSFDDDTKKDAIATFSTPGVYTLQLVASDGELDSNPAEVGIQVIEQLFDDPTNFAPVPTANGGEITFPTNTLQLNGDATDDGLPNGTLTYKWTAIGENSGNVSFDDDTKKDAIATFSTPGTYELSLNVSDGELSGALVVEVIVNPAPFADFVADPPVSNVSLGETVTIQVDVESSGIDLDGAVVQLVFNPIYFSLDENFITNVSGFSTELVKTVSDDPDSELKVIQFDIAAITSNSEATQSGNFDLLELVFQTLAATPQGGTSISHRVVSADNPFGSNLTSAGNTVLGNVENFTVNISGANQAPVADAGENGSINLPINTYQLNGSAIDEGLPDNSVITYKWTATGANVGNVSFDDDTKADAIASFSAAGTYILELVASDGELSSVASQVEITVVPAPVTNPMVLITVNPGAALGASTFGNNSFEIFNQGDVNITNITIDASTTYFPDVVFDPVGKAGDNGAKCLTTGNGGNTAAEVGITVPANGGSDAADCESVFNAPHNGIDDEEGYDIISLDFTDFNPTEQYNFGVDMDPTTIKGDLTTGDAGSISGFELIGATVTVTFADGTVLIGSLFDEGSLGGSQVKLSKTSSTSAPSISVEGVSSVPAFVSNLNQTININGPANATVCLLQVDGRLYIDPGNPEIGYDIDTFEANEAIAKNLIENVQLDENGQAAVPVTLLQTTSSNAGPDGGINHFIAVVKGTDPETSPTSNVVVLEFRANNAPVAFAGDDAQILLPENTYQLNGFASDDGVPGTGLTYLWTAIGNNAGNVSFDDNTLPDATATFSTVGLYTLQLVVNDGELNSVPDFIAINVIEQPSDDPTQNQPPIPSAAGGEITLPTNTFQLSGSAQDDGLPNNTLTYKWVAIGENAGNVSFDDDTKPDAIATFSEAGTYLLSLNVSDGEFEGGLAVEVIVNALAKPCVLVEVNPGAALGASTFSGNSFQITNNGDVDITKIEINTSTTYMPDVVFDPLGKAGDSTPKCLTASNTANSAAEVGLTVPANGGLQDDDCVSVFEEPHNGTDDDEGFDKLVLDFTDFNPSEEFHFSVDMDPVSIKGDLTSGNSGSISGFELIGATVTVTFEDGTVLTGSLWDEGSLGGSAVKLSNTSPTQAPVINVEGISPVPAFVNELSQTINISGPANAIVCLLQVDARLYIDPGNPGVGYDLSQFDANAAMAKTLYENIQLDENGQASVPVNIMQSESPDAGPDGGINHFIAVVKGSDPETSPTSNVVVLEYTEVTPPSTGGPFYLEAECIGVIGSQFNIVEDAQASKGEAVIATGSINSIFLSQPPIGPEYNIEFQVNIPEGQAGTYYMFARLLAKGGADDSYWVTVNGETPIKWNNIPDNTSYQWVTLFDDDQPNDPQVALNLSVGLNTFKITYREPNIRLDKLCLGTSPELPVGLGPDATNCEDEPLVNQAPVANAGQNTSISLPTNTYVLQGQATDDGLPGSGLTYLWTAIGGNAGNVSFDDDTNPNAEATFPAAGVYTVQLVVNDGELSSQPSQVVITVNPEPSGNQLPIAEAGPNQILEDTDEGGGEQVNLDGSASSDPDGSIASYVWTENGQQIAVGPTPTVVMNVGVHVITLTVTDNEGATATDQVTVTVNSPTPPVAGGPFIMEAECADVIGSAFTEVDQASSSKGAALKAQSLGAFLSAPPTGDQYKVVFLLNVAEEDAGTYYVFARVIAKGGSDDSFWFSANSQSPIKWNNMPDNNDYQWVELFDSDQGNAQVAIQLTAGLNTIEIYYREPNIVLDKLYISQTNEAPAVVGAEGTNCGTPPSNIPPVANAGLNIEVTDFDNNNTESVALNASASSDVDGTIESYEWREAGQLIATGSNPNVSFEVGVHEVTLTVTDDDGATGTDQLTITVNQGVTGGDGQTIKLEAECATAIGSNFSVISDANASNGFAVQATNGFRFLSVANDVPEFIIRMNFLVQNPGLFDIYVRTLAISASRDSYWVRIDGGEWIKFNEIAASTSYSIVQLFDSDNGKATVSVNLTQGQHTIEFGYREPEVILDFVTLTSEDNVPANAPGVKGENCVNALLREAIGYDLRVYPNPAADMATLSVGGEESGWFTVKMTDMAGKVIETYNFKKDRGNYDLKMSLKDLPEGVYMISVETDEYREVLRLMHMN